MEIILWIIAVKMSFGFAYTMQFSAATLSIGRELSGTNSGTGFQNAITPPWQTNFAILVYIGCLSLIVIRWWQIGWLYALACAAVIFFGSVFAKLLLPKPSNGHYRNLIFKSMRSRYANFLRDGDKKRAQAIEHLLIKAGLTPDTEALSPMPKDWLKKKLTVEQAEAHHMVTAIRLGPAPVPFGFSNNEWRQFLAGKQNGDELWEFSSPPDSWANDCGLGGIALLRNGEVVASLVTVEN